MSIVEAIQDEVLKEVAEKEALIIEQKKTENKWIQNYKYNVETIKNNISTLQNEERKAH